MVSRIQHIRRVTLYIYLFSINFEVFNLFGLGSTSFFTSLLYVVSLSSNLGQFLRLSTFKKTFQIIWVFFFYISIISLINMDSSNPMFIDVTLFLNILLFIMITNHNVKDPGILNKGLLAFALGSFAISVLYYFGIGLETAGGRISIFGDNENSVALRLCVSILIIIISALNNADIGKKVKFVFLLMTPLMFTFMINTGSRTAIISLVVALSVFILRLKLKSKFRKFTLYIMVILLSIPLFDVVMQNEVISSRMNKTIENNDLAGRDRIWGVLIGIIEKNPITGHGTTGYQRLSAEAFGKFNAAHNVFIEVLVIGGIIGLFIYLYFVQRIFYKAWGASKRFNYHMPLCLFIVFTLILITSHALTNKMTWFILAYALSSYHILQNKSKNENSLLHR